MIDKKAKAVRNRKLKYGSLAVTLTVVCVALVVVVNAIFSALANKYLWYIDMTEEQIYGITDASRILLDEYEGLDDFRVTILFCAPKDKLTSSYNTNMVYNCARQFEEEYDFINIDFCDVVTHPSSVDKYMTTAVSKITASSVIITNGEDYRVLALTDFYTFSSETGAVFAFNGEYRITSSIVQMDGNNPIAYFVEGHGESNEGSVMYTLFEEAGFEVRTIDLSKENIDSNAKVMVINNPKYDYMGAGATINEIAKVDHFLDNFGSLMVFMDGTPKNMPELSEFLEEWGIRFENAVIRDYSNSLSVDGTELVAEYTTDGSGASLHTSIRDLATPPKAVVNYACPITVLFEEKGLRTTSSVLRTSSKVTAEALYHNDDTADGITGIYDLMVLSYEERYIDNEPHYSYVLAAGTSSFADDKYIGSATYSNRDIIFSAMKAFCKEAVPTDLSFKVFEDETLDITTAEANRFTVIYTAILPIAVFIVAAVVYIRRRHL